MKSNRRQFYSVWPHWEEAQKGQVTLQVHLWVPAMRAGLSRGQHCAHLSSPVQGVVRLSPTLHCSGPTILEPWQVAELFPGDTSL